MNLDSLVAHGSLAPVPTQTSLRAGQLSMLYEKGFLRYIRLGKIEVLRMINHAVRDHNWSTIPIEIVSEEISVEEDSFQLTYVCEAKRRGETILRWHCQIRGTADSVLEFEIEGTIEQDFQRNRVGFTILHPTEDSIGRTVTLIHPEEETSEKSFPKFISPDQIFYDIQQMIIPYEDGQEVKITFEGDLFETEDQRNWLDDSYKTYCTPLRLPMPVKLQNGDTVRQVIRLEASSTKESNSYEASPLSFFLSESTFFLPPIGIGQSSEEQSLSPHTLEQLARLPFDHYQVDIPFQEEGWREQWERAVREFDLLGLPMELALFFDNAEQEINSFVSILENDQSNVSRIHIFNLSPFTTQPKTLDTVLPHLRKHFPEASIGAGTNAFFTQLNRERFPVSEIDHLVFSVNPQVHAVDHATLVENLNTIQHSIASARQFAEGKAIHVGPITLKMRWNPDATGPMITPKGELPFNVDLRQLSMFTASWTLGMINQLVKSEAEAATFFETSGSRGIMQSQTLLYPDLFPASSGQLYPVFWLFEQILAHKEASFQVVEPSDPLRFCGLAFQENGRMELLLGSFDADEMEVHVAEAFKGAEAVIISTEDMKQYGQDPATIQKLKGKIINETVVLPPFGLAKLVV